VKQVALSAPRREQPLDFRYIVRIVGAKGGLAVPYSTRRDVLAANAGEFTRHQQHLRMEGLYFKHRIALLDQGLDDIQRRGT
jgi:hypothetical protein